MHVLGAEGCGGKCTNKSRIDTATETNDTALQAIFGEIFAETHDESLVDKLHNFRLFILTCRQQLQVDAHAVFLEIGELAED